MKKLLILISCLLFLTGCNSDNIKSYTTKNGISFEYQDTWQVLHKGLREQSANSPLERQDMVSINFETPHDIGPYGTIVDVTIEDKILKDQTITLEQYVNNLVAENGGEITEYFSPNGTKYTVWNIENYTYDGFFTSFYTSYTNEEGYHIVEIYNLSPDADKNFKELQPIVDSIKLPTNNILSKN